MMPYLGPCAEAPVHYSGCTGSSYGPGGETLKVNAKFLLEEPRGETVCWGLLHIILLLVIYCVAFMLCVHH